MAANYLFDDSARRFSQRVANHVRYRPGYPVALADPFTREAPLIADSLIADIGSGTGILSRVFLAAGFRVTGVEPNEDMRAAGDQELAAFPHFHSVEGRADATSLPNASCDFITAGQAFHWSTLSPRAPSGSAS